MPRASKYVFQENKFKELQEHFSQLISSLSKSTEIQGFFDEFLTREEKIMLAKRLMLFMLLKKGYSPSTIQGILHVSPETVRLYQERIMDKSELFHKIIDKLTTKDKTKEFFSRIEKIMRPFDLALRSRNDMKARAELASGQFDGKD